MTPGEIYEFNITFHPSAISSRRAIRSGSLYQQQLPGVRSQPEHGGAGGLERADDRRGEHRLPRLEAPVAHRAPHDAKVSDGTKKAVRHALGRPSTRRSGSAWDCRPGSFVWPRLLIPSSFSMGTTLRRMWLSAPEPAILHPLHLHTDVMGEEQLVSVSSFEELFRVAKSLVISFGNAARI